MGEQKRRQKQFKEKALTVKNHFSEYLSFLQDLKFSSQKAGAELPIPEIAASGRAEIWACEDAAIVVIYDTADRDVSVSIAGYTSKSALDFLSSSDVGRLYSPDGKPAPNRMAFGTSPDALVSIAAPTAEIDGVQYRPKHSKLMLVGWNKDLGQPSEMAVRTFSEACIIQNLAEEAPSETPLEVRKQSAVDRANELVDEFRAILETAEREEDVQRFLKEHPELIYPDYLECFPKFKLGKQYVTDYVMLVQSKSGLEHVFVEIEKPDKKLSVKKGHFSAHYTQAKDQLLDWTKWVGENREYLEDRLQDFRHDAYHLVMGREQSVTAHIRDKIKLDFDGSKRRFSTYDELADHFLAIVERIS